MTRFWGLFLLITVPVCAARVDIREGRFYVDDKPFYVRAIAYGPWRPHQMPGTSYTDTNRRWTEKDFARIKAAHFNTIRTWEPLEPEDLALARQYGLMVLQGIRMDTHQNFADPHNQETAAEQVRLTAEAGKMADNILGYMVLSRTDPSAILRSGVDNTQQFFRRLKRTIQTVDPRPVAMERWWPTAFLDDPDSDFGAFSAFSFWPKSLNYALGYAGIVQWVVDHQGKNKPLLITETGGFSVSQASVTAAGGAGGLDEYAQSMKDIGNLRAVVQGHAQGAALVSWIDNWCFSRDAETHDNEPWEWTGIVGIATDSKKDMDGIPRRALQDLKEYNQITVLEPKTDHFYPPLQTEPIAVYGSPETIGVRYSLNGGDWIRLQGSHEGWFIGSFKLPKLARRRQRLAFQALDKEDSVVGEKEVSFVAALEPESMRVALNPTGETAARLSFHAVVRNGDGQPVAKRNVLFGCFYPVSGLEDQGTATTDSTGLATFTCTMPKDRPERYLYAAAGTDSPEHVRSGDLRIFELGRAHER